MKDLIVENLKKSVKLNHDKHVGLKEYKLK